MQGSQQLFSGRAEAFSGGRTCHLLDIRADLAGLSGGGWGQGWVLREGNDNEDEITFLLYDLEEDH